MSTTAVRPHSNARDVLVWTLTLLVLLGICVALHNSSATPSDPQSFYGAANQQCSEDKAPEAGLMLGPGSVAGELPDVGAPSEIIVAPSCYKYSQVPPTFFLPEVTVYLVISPQQLAKLSTHGVTADDLPFGVQDKALTHLVTKQQRTTIESGAKSDKVEFQYVLTTSDTNAPRVQAGVPLGSLEQQTLPRDLLSGTYYTREPIPSVREAYTSGPVIVVR